MTYLKIYEQMQVKQTKFYDFQMSDFTPMVKYSLSAISNNQFFYLYFIIMHGLKVITICLKSSLSISLIMNQYSGSAKNKLACANFEVLDQPVRQYHTRMCSQQHIIVYGGGGGGGGGNEHSCYASIA